MPEDLLTKIDSLSDKDLVEAATYYLAPAVGVRSSVEAEARIDQECATLGGDAKDLRAIRDEMARDRDSYRLLLRFLLREAAQGTKKERDKVAAAVEAVGQKQFIADPLTAAAFGLIATIVLIRTTGGKVEEVRERITQTSPDGTVHEKETVKTTYAAPTTLGRFFQWLKSVSFGKPAGS